MEKQKIAILILVVFIILGGVGFSVYYLYFYKKAQETAAPTDIVREQKPPLEPSETVFKEAETVDFLNVSLDSSDEVIAKFAKRLSPHPQLATWFKQKNLIRKFTVVIDNIVHNASPRKHVPFLAPKGDFQVVEKNGLLRINPDSYSRYNLLADVFSSLDSEECANIYRQAKPLIQQAYRELGYPTENFDNTFTKAIIILLKTPVVEGDIYVERKVIAYKMIDAKLEQLGPPQKHLLRMGPENVRKIQRALRRIALALGIPENQLPEPKVYSPEKLQ
jgi:hypothetical protein